MFNSKQLTKKRHRKLKKKSYEKDPFHKKIQKRERRKDTERRMIKAEA